MRSGHAIDPEVDARIAQGDGPLYKFRSLIQAAMGNWASVVHTAPHLQTAPAQTCVACIVLPVQASGIFHVEVECPWSDNTAAEQVTFTLATQTSVGSGATLTGGGTASGILGNNTSGGAAQVLLADGAGGNGIVYNGAAFSLGLTQYSQIAATLAGLLTANATGAQSFGVTGFMQNASNTTVKTPFVKPNFAAFGLLVTAVHNITIPDLSFSVVEWPIL